METFTLQAHVYRTQNIGHCTTEIALYSKSMSAQYAIADHTRKTFLTDSISPSSFLIIRQLEATERFPH